VQKQLIEAPASDSSRTFEPLGYVEAYDAPLNADYSFVIYKETDRDTGAWRVRIRSSGMTGVVFEPEQMRLQARAAGAQGKPFFTWGAGITPSASDQRHVEYRVHVEGGKPSAVEIILQLRKFDGTADEAKSCRAPWPA
jgi:hypothetical protein